MPYYMGDYYRGDYYRGGRGDLWGAIKGAAVGFLTGGPAGAVIGGLTGAGASAGTAAAAGGIVSSGALSGLMGRTGGFVPPRPSGHPVTISTQTPLGGVSITPTAIIPGGAPFVSFHGPGGGACPKGTKPNKSSYFLRDGTFIEAGSRCVRFRSMNPLNHRALKRGVRRAEGFVKIARRTLTATTLPKRGGSKFKRRKR